MEERPPGGGQTDTDNPAEDDSVTHTLEVELNSFSDATISFANWHGATIVLEENIAYDDVELEQGQYEALTAYLYETGTTTDPVDTITGDRFFYDSNTVRFKADYTKFPEGTSSYDLYVTYTDDGKETAKAGPFTVTFQREAPILMKEGGNTVYTDEIGGQAMLGVEGVDDPWDGMSVQDVLDNLTVTVDESSGFGLRYSKVGFNAYDITVWNRGMMFIDYGETADDATAVWLDQLWGNYTWEFKLQLNGKEYSLTLKNSST